MARKNAATRKDLQGNFDVGRGNPEFTAKPDKDAPNRHENLTSGYPLTRVARRPVSERKKHGQRTPAKR